MKKTIVTLVLTLTCAANTIYAQPVETKDINDEVRTYISGSWDNLTRKNSDIQLLHADPKIPNAKLIVYISKKEDLDRISNEINGQLTKDQTKRVEIRYLPDDISSINEHGLLYLPKPYVVPGGRFNEMYGWDSYFIELGLIKNNRLELAKNMIDNLIYEIDNYGTILNANRTYYLQRSQPPLLSEMVLAYYEAKPDKEWLKSTLPALEKLWSYWMTPEHLIPNLGLSRYNAGGEGPTPEESPEYYVKAAEYYRMHEIGDYDKSLYYDEKTNKLTDLFYRADRTVRESGFDITAKYGPFGAAILDYAPVDLNALLYQLEKDISTVYTKLNDIKSAKLWQERADKRAAIINKFMWNESLGYYFDYNYKTHRLRPYVYATTFYPLWAGIASQEQADDVASNLPNLLAAGGIVTSTYRPRLQWDAPFGWAPMQYFAVEGLKRYGYDEEAREVAKRFIATVNSGFKEGHTIYEKYDVQKVSIHTGTKIGFSYSTNETGFGWTNGTYLLFDSYISSIAQPNKSQITI